MRQQCKDMSFRVTVLLTIVYMCVTASDQALKPWIQDCNGCCLSCSHSDLRKQCTTGTVQTAYQVRMCMALHQHAAVHLSKGRIVNDVIACACEEPWPVLNLDQICQNQVSSCMHLWSKP